MNFKKTVAIATAVGALTALAIPAMAETTLYGSARLGTFWNTVQAKTSAAAARDNNTDLAESLYTNSRLGVNFANGSQTGKVEIGLGTGGLSTRHIYGAQKFDFGTVLVGQTENPYYFYSAQVTGPGSDNVNNNYGALWDTRQAQIKLTLNNGVYIAAIQPTPAAAGNEVLFPKMNVGYEGKAGNFAYGAGVVGQTFRNETIKRNINSVLGYVHGTFKADAASIIFNLGVGRNTGDMGFTNANAVATNVYNTANSKDTTSAEGFVQGSVTLAPTLKLNVGVGYAMDKNASFVKTDNRMLAFVNAPVTLAKGFTMVPEVAYIDQLTQAANFKGNKEILVGAKWQMDF